MGDVVEDDSGHPVGVRSEFVLDFREGAQELAGDVGEDGSAAGGNLVLTTRAATVERKSLILVADLKSSSLPVKWAERSVSSGVVVGRRV